MKYTSWSTCSPDIILLIFKRLDYETLLACFSVCKLWRDVVDYMGQGNGGALWQKLAEIGLYNKGIPFKQKSTLNWREVYFNSLLWLNYMDNIDFKLVKSIKIQHVRNIHVYKDYIIVVGVSDVKFCNVHTFEVRKTLQKSCIDYQESDHIIVERNERNVSIGLKHNMSGFTFKGLFFKLIDDCCYIVDENCVLWRITCCNKNEINSLLRTYGGKESIVDINVYENDVFVLMRNGIVYHGTGTCTEFEMVCDLNTSDFYKCPALAMFQLFSVAYSVPMQNGSISESDDEFVKTVDMSDEILMACPGLSCATPHGDILFLGYEDGKIVIRIRGREISYLKLNMWAIENPTAGGAAIKAIDVCEVRGAHYLFVLTQFEIFKLVLTHIKNE